MRIGKRRLDDDDHRMLGYLIRGSTLEEVAVIMALPIGTVRSRMDRMRKFLECRTTYQVIALEVINLMGTEEAGMEESRREDIPVKVRAACA